MLKKSQFCLIFYFLTAPFAWSQDNVRGSTSNDAYKTFQDLSVSGVLMDARPTMVKNSFNVNSGRVTFGAEKEGTSYLVTNVMGPSQKRFEIFLKNIDRGGHTGFETKFLKKLLSGLKSGIYRSPKVIDLNGNVKNIDYRRIESLDIDNLSYKQLKAEMIAWLDQTQNRPFAFLAPTAREEIYEGYFIEESGPEVSFKYLRGWYTDWIPHFGMPEKYIDDSVPSVNSHMNGWEIRFKPKQSYGEFEDLIKWFKNALTDAKNPTPFEAPGHQRIVFPEMAFADKADLEVMRGRVAETYRAMQTLIVLKGVAGSTGIDKSSWKRITLDHEMKNLLSDRGVIRLEKHRWGDHTQGIEIRAGTKDPNVQRLVEKSLAARVSTNDWKGMHSIDDYALVPYELVKFKGWTAIETESMDNIANRFGVTRGEIRTFLNKFKGIYDEDTHKKIKYDFLVPFWKWEEVPFLDSHKKAFLRNLSQDYIKRVVAIKNPSISKLSDFLKDWVKASDLATDFEEYLTPKVVITPDSKRDQFPLPANAKVDVNKVHLGIEYTSGFPVSYTGSYTERLEDGKFHWMETHIGLSQEERKETIKRLAETLAQEVGAGPETRVVNEVIEGTHGHGISISYGFRDAKGRKWRVEWDGIQREYDSEGKVNKKSLRGGHMELVTPKDTMTAKEISAVFNAYKKNSMHPNSNAGGGHVNIDLAPFKDKPQTLARFLSAFHKHRGVISLMFQHINRLRSAEPTDVSPELNRKLQTFNGSDEDLKKLLYNERYFNPRVGRKTRYIQIDLGSYFQDVIPEKFVSEDFDINSPIVPWRQQFRIDPKIRKMEMRMMNAPKDGLESSLQMKLVRALLNKGLNETSPITGAVQEVNHKKYLDNPQLAFEHLKALTDELGLDFEEYKGYVARGIQHTEYAMSSIHFNSLEEKLKGYDVINEWGEAITPRSPAESLSSEGRKWMQADGSTLTGKLEAVQEFLDKRQVAVAAAAQARQEHKEGKLIFAPNQDCFRRVNESDVLQQAQQDPSVILTRKVGGILRRI